MAKLIGSLAWSVPVPIEVLGAHLAAYTKLHSSVIHTLRLCHRYGQGEKVTVTKLPLELLLQIEGYLVDDERAEQRKDWDYDFKCFENRCRPLEHFSEQELRDLYLDFFSESVCDCCGGHGSLSDVQAGRELTENQRAEIREVLAEGGADSWFEEHHEHVGEWMEKCGLIGLSSTGHAKFFRRHFGLEMFVSHTQPTTPKDGQGTVDSVYQSTRAYLMFSCSTFTQETKRPYNEDGIVDDPSCMSGDAGFELPVELPSKLSDVDTARFARALKILDIEPCESKPTGLKLSASGHFARDEAEHKEDGVPKLRLLMRSHLFAEEFGY